MARPQAIHSYLPNHNEVANDFIKLLQEKIEANADTVTLKDFEQNLRLLALECKRKKKLYN